MFGTIVNTAATTPGAAILNATTDYLPQMAAVGGGAIVVGAGLLVWRRGWSFFKGLAK